MTNCNRPALVPALTGGLRTRVLILALTVASGASFSQTATVEGSLASFDVVNDTGQLAHGFEIQIEGVTQGDLYYTMPGQRYGNPTVVPYATGVYIRYQSPYDSATGQYTKTTPQHAPGTPFSWNDCYLLGARYSVSGCEHFGQSMRPLQPGQVVKVTGRWLVESSTAPGTLVPVNPPAAIPFATWFVSPPVVVSAPPVVVAEVEAPEPPETPEKYGDAQWVKIFKTQLPRPVIADELTSDNTAVVPEDPTQVEVAWDILQASPPSGTNSNGNQNRTRKRNQGSISADTRSVIRRYELYKYTGAYDATTHKVACADGLCNAPSPGELGDALSAQNTAVNVVPDALIVTRDGAGLVSGGTINCGNACSGFAPKGTAISVTANPGGNAFLGWAGACTGKSLTCSATVNGQTPLTATFRPQFTLSVGRSNPGTVTATPAGNDRTLDCGGACSAKFTSGTAVTLTAIPPAGKAFVNWAGACSGTALTCTVAIGKDTSVQAVFSK